MNSALGTIHIDEIIDEVVVRLAENFNPLKIFLFGSHARGNARDESDLDLLVVMPNGTDRRQTAIQMHQRLRDLLMPKDIVVTTPEEISRRGQMIGSMLASAIREGRVLYERS